MVSRLDRLFILLDTGSNDSIRLAAAKHLGEVQKVQPNDLGYLLRRIKDYSCKSVWETRVAAGLAIKCILEHVDPPAPTIEFREAGSGYPIGIDTSADLVSQIADTPEIFQGFNLNKIISICPSLLSTNRIDNDDQEQASTSKGSQNSKKGRLGGSGTKGAKKPTKEQLLRQRQLINKELGISIVDSLNIGVKSTDIISNDDLQTEYRANSTSSQDDQQLDPRKILRDIISNYDKVVKKLTQAGLMNPSKDDCDDLKTRNMQTLLDVSREYEEGLFECSWEIRHGSSIALREIIRAHGKNLAKGKDLPDEISFKLNQIWLIDIALKAICVLALDRFNDFLFDQVVAPVRENAAQLLGCCITSMNKSNASSTIEILLKMLENSSWETRHGGILGLKYTLSVLGEDTARDALKQSFDAIYKCLGDPNDDVSAEAAAALVPVKNLLMETIPERTPKLIKFLWGHLAYLDDLTSSTSNIILLLASLITSNSAHLEPEELIKSIPRLWPILSHSSTTVRISVLKALITLITAQKISCLHWMPQDLLTTALRLLFQRCIVENMQEVRPYIEDAWMAIIRVDKDDSINETERLNLLQSSSQYLNYWLCLTMQHSNTPIDRANPLWLKLRSDGSVSDEKPDGEIYIASSTFNAETLNEQKSQIIKCRLLATNLLGALFSSIVANPKESQHILDSLKYISDMFAHYLNTKSANQRMISGWTIEAWARHQASHIDYIEENMRRIPSDNLKQQLNVAIQDINLCYDELAASLTRLQQEAREFMSTLVACNIPTNLPISPDKRIIYSLNQILSMCELDIEDELSRANFKRRANSDGKTQEPKDAPSLIALLSKRSSLLKSYHSTKSSQRLYSISTLSSLACALISWWLIPERLKLVVEPLLDSIESETDQSIQRKSVDYLVRLVNILCQEQEKNQAHINVILERLSKAVQLPINSGNDTKLLPVALGSEAGEYRIVFLDNLQRKAEQAVESVRRQSSICSTAPVKRSHSITASSDSVSEPTSDQLFTFNGFLQDTRYIGASLALNELVKHFAVELPHRLPDLWKSTTSDLESDIISFTNSTQENSQEAISSRLITNMSVLQIVCESLHPSFRLKLLDLLPNLKTLLASSCAIVRHQSSRCIGSISKLMFNEVESWICQEIIPMLDSDRILARCGAIEAIAHIIEHIQYDSVSSIDVFVVNVLRRMSDQNEQVRLTATHCFGKLLSLMPLKLTQIKQELESSESEVSNGPNEFTFIEQLFNPKKLTNYRIPFETKSELRPYQQEGLNWLAFLEKFNLHGILCDEMGLGKTFMTICVVASNHYRRGSQTNTPITNNTPSLIVCPATLVDHWLFEIEKFVPDRTQAILNSARYAGSQAQRASLRSKLATTINKLDQAKEEAQHERPINLVVTSYESLRNDSDFFASIDWNYCVLDEGHIIKNAKTKLSRAVRSLTARHRLILSGTPIQNNVTELWSLFDLLMPGFLGSERQFNARFAKPILQSRESKCSKKDLEAGALAMEALHRQVLPFVLRRLKEDVLNDLPPKIIQDYYCELSSLQTKLYEDYTRSRLCQDVTKSSLHELDRNGIQVGGSQDKSKSHVFQALQYLKNVCNHPKLVLTPKHPQFTEVEKQLKSEKKTLDDINHSSKLKALKQLLIDCGIATQSADDSQQTSTQAQVPGEIQSVVNQHRALIFFQVRSMVDIVESDLFSKHLPNITYLKLDGSVPANKRQEIVTRFNNDPSIDVLLITTRVGGLGLNLTGADTVIFVEHDWNPTRDLQAMDRVHRIGQKKVVNVYRLITKDTLEEKIMGLQKFKTMVSNTVINQDNAGLGTMNVEQLLDLFDSSGCQKSETQPSQARSSDNKRNNFMDLLPELWDQQQYETEYDLSSFVSSLKN